MTYAALAKLKKNSVSTTLDGGIASGAPTIAVTQCSVFYDEDAVLITKGILIGYNSGTETDSEEITITGCSAASGSGNLTGVTRGVKANGSNGAAKAWDTGTRIAVMFSTGIYDQICDNIAAHESGKEPVISSKATAFNKSYGTDTNDVKQAGTASVGIVDAVARIDHTHPVGGGGNASGILTYMGL